jgi:GrpB-like predicted nucleotidyltransferase (UPF0157 family)
VSFGTNNGLSKVDIPVLAFRDYLRFHPDFVKEDGNLKEELS